MPGMLILYRLSCTADRALERGVEAAYIAAASVCKLCITMYMSLQLLAAIIYYIMMQYTIACCYNILYIDAIYNCFLL